jgi:hypothetical protein
MQGLSLYLFQCIGSTIYAMAADQTGRSVRKHSPDDVWLLRAEVPRSEVPAAVLVSIDQVGYCLLDEDEIRTTRSQWLWRQRRG